MKTLSLNWLTKMDCSKSLKIISYLFILNLAPFLLQKSNPEVAFHAKQGFIQLVIWLLIPYALLIPLVGWVLGVVLLVANIALMVAGIYSVVKGKNNYVPFIGKFVEKILL